MAPAYCCPSKNGANDSSDHIDLRCSPAAFLLPATLLDARGKKRYAVVTLLMRGDAYLPGCLLLARSLREVSPGLSAQVDIVCMVTPDVSQVARADLKTEFDSVIEVPYMSLPEARIAHRPDVRPVYARTFTKLNCLNLLQYNKILLMDADMVVVRPEIYSLFALEPPAAVFFGCLRQFMESQFADHISYYCPLLTHGELIPKTLFEDKACRRVPRQSYSNNTRASKQDKRVYIGVETSIVLLEPNVADLGAMKATMAADAASTGPPKYAGDTTLMSEAYEGRWRAMDMRFLGRWTNPTLRPEVFTVDLYGTEGKPWDIVHMDAAKVAAMRTYPDVGYWLKKFKQARFDKTCKHSTISSLYSGFEKKRS